MEYTAVIEETRECRVKVFAAHDAEARSLAMAHVGAPDVALLTHREHEVVSLIGAGLSNKEIAKALGIAPHTAKCHVRNTMEKLSLHSRLQIAAYAHHAGTTYVPDPGCHPDPQRVEWTVLPRRVWLMSEAGSDVRSPDIL